jgi:hypothetical protein
MEGRADATAVGQKETHSQLMISGSLQMCEPAGPMLRCACSCLKCGFAPPGPIPKSTEAHSVHILLCFQFGDCGGQGMHNRTESQSQALEPGIQWS